MPHSPEDHELQLSSGCCMLHYVHRLLLPQVVEVSCCFSLFSSTSAQRCMSLVCTRMVLSTDLGPFH